MSLSVTMTLTVVIFFCESPLTARVIVDGYDVSAHCGWCLMVGVRVVHGGCVATIVMMAVLAAAVREISMKTLYLL